MKILPDSIPRARLSVAMIARDEQDLIGETIDAARTLADQTVVLDACSTDRTAEIARECGAVVDQIFWPDSFAAARNRCAEQADGPWVLWLNAGERFDAESVQPLREFLDHRADQRIAYRLLVEMPPADGASAAERMMQIRLMPSRGKLRFEGRVRETLQPAIDAAGMTVADGPGRIVCHARNHHPERKVERAKRNLKLATLDALERGGWSARLLLAAGEAYSMLDAMDRSRQAFREALAAAQSGSDEMLEAYYGLLGALDGEAACHQDQLQVCLEALRIFPYDMQLLLALGNYLQIRGRWNLACRVLDAAVRFGKTQKTVWHLDGLDQMATVCLAFAQHAAGHQTDARRTLQEAVARRPDCPQLRRAMIDLHVRQGDIEEAIAAAVTSELQQYLAAVNPPRNGETEGTDPLDGRRVRIDPGATPTDAGPKTGLPAAADKARS